MCKHCSDSLKRRSDSHALNFMKDVVEECVLVPLISVSPIRQMHAIICAYMRVHLFLSESSPFEKEVNALTGVGSTTSSHKKANMTVFMCACVRVNDVCACFFAVCTSTHAPELPGLLRHILLVNGICLHLLSLRAHINTLI